MIHSNLEYNSNITHVNTILALLLSSVAWRHLIAMKYVYFHIHRIITVQCESYIKYIHVFWGRDNSAGIANRLRAGQPGFDSRQA
jgi:hypothetical protein